MFKNKRNIILSILGVVLIALLITLSILLYQKYEEDKLKENILSHYGEFVKFTKDSYLYNNEKEKIVNVYENLSLELDKISDEINDYFKIRNHDLYVLYSDVEKIKELNNYEMYNDLLKYPYKNYTVKLLDNAVFYQNDKKLFSKKIDESLKVVMEDENNYYVNFNDNVYQLKKDEVTKEELTEKVSYLEKLSVFYFDDFTDIDKKLSYLKEKEISSISPTDLQRFLNGNVELNKNSVLLFYNKDLDLSKIDTLGFNFYLESDTDIKFKSGDSQINQKTESFTWYKVNKNTSLNRFKDMVAGKKEVKVTVSSSPNNSVAVLNYHFFYSSQNGESCNESICLDTSNFEKQLKYLKDNNIDTLTMQEYVDWIYGRKTLTKKSVLITVDDGAMGTDTHLPDLLDKYDAKATLFLISGWWPMSKYRTGNLEIQSHTHDLHHNNFVRDGKKGIKTVMITYDELMTDLSKSVETVGTNLAFCYPFYAYNNTLVQAVKDTGFQVAFVGGNKKSTRSSNKYKIPRYIVYKNTSLNSFKNMVN